MAGVAQGVSAWASDLTEAQASLDRDIPQGWNEEVPVHTLFLVSPTLSQRLLLLLQTVTTGKVTSIHPT